MALPKVTYGTYNYGEYARPTAIRYKGGFGEGLAEGAKEFIKGVEKGKQQVVAAKEQGYIKSEEYEEKVNKALGSASAINRQFVVDLKKDVGDLVKNYKLRKISLEEYSNKMDGYDNILLELQQISGLTSDISKSDNPEINLEDIRFGEDNFTSAMIRGALQKQNFILSRNKEGNGVNLALPTKKPTDFQIKNISGKNLISNSKLYSPQIKFDFVPDAAAANILKKAFESNALTSKTKKVGNDTIKYYKMDGTSPQLNSFIQNNFNKDQVLNSLTPEQKEAYYEDSIEDKVMGEYKGTPEQKNEIYNAMVEEVKTKILTSEFGHKDITATVNKEQQEQDDLLSAQRNFELYTSNVDGIKNYFIDRRLTYGRDNIAEGSKPGSIKITSTIKNEDDEDTIQSYELDLTNKETFRFVVGNMMRDDLKKDYPGVKSSEAIGRYNIDNVYNNFMKQIKNTTVKFNPDTGELEEKNNVEKALEEGDIFGLDFIQTLKRIPGVRAGK